MLRLILRRPAAMFVCPAIRRTLIGFANEVGPGAPMELAPPLTYYS